MEVFRCLRRVGGKPGASSGPRQGQGAYGRKASRRGRLAERPGYSGRDLCRHALGAGAAPRADRRRIREAAGPWRNEEGPPSRLPAEVRPVGGVPLSGLHWGGSLGPTALAYQAAAALRLWTHPRTWGRGLRNPAR